MKTKQAQTSLLMEKQALTKQFQQVNASLESLKKRIGQSEEEVKNLFVAFILISTFYLICILSFEASD